MSRTAQHKQRMTAQQPKRTLCERMAAFLKALGLENKPEYTEKIPEALCDEDFHIHDVSFEMNVQKIM